MNGKVPNSATYVVVGAGVHGLSTSWHLAMYLEAQGKGSGKDVLLLDKAMPGAGATGIACGCVRNFYMTEPLHAILRHSVDVWNYDPVAFGFQQVGYVSCGEENQITDYERVHKSQNNVGYCSDLYVGQDARAHLSTIWPDFKHHGIDVVLHEKPSGYAGTAQAVHGLAQMCRRHGVSICNGVEVQGYDITNGQVSTVRTNKGEIKCDVVVLGLGAWTPQHWQMLQKPMKIDVKYGDGSFVVDKDMWTYWRLEEGEIYYDGPYYSADNRNPPILHVELMNTPVNDPQTGTELKDNVYVYWKNGTERMELPGIQGGAMPVMIGPEATIEPYGHANDKYQAESQFADYITACMGMFMKRFEGIRPNFKDRRNGGIGAFTPDNIPIIDWIMPNVYMIADSNHGFKMTGIGKLVARHLVSGNDVGELKPFAFNRYEKGTSFGSGTTHSPWV
ncbi:MAG: FAD-binding oxidoreductase [Gammaproteobacteria bacterium]|nr:FAD-binding oxidoreductase [Gammaproteobacteria bacterium]